MERYIVVLKVNMRVNLRVIFSENWRINLRLLNILKSLDIEGRKLIYEILVMFFVFINYLKREYGGLVVMWMIFRVFFIFFYVFGRMFSFWIEIRRLNEVLCVIYVFRVFRDGRGFVFLGYIERERVSK